MTSLYSITLFVAHVIMILHDWSQHQTPFFDGSWGVLRGFPCEYHNDMQLAELLNGKLIFGEEKLHWIGCMHTSIQQIPQAIIFHRSKSEAYTRITTEPKNKKNLPTQLSYLYPPVNCWTALLFLINFRIVVTIDMVSLRFWRTFIYVISGKLFRGGSVYTLTRRNKYGYASQKKSGKQTHHLYSLCDLFTPHTHKQKHLVMLTWPKTPAMRAQKMNLFWHVLICQKIMLWILQRPRGERQFLQVFM